jgi:hypothetical protein
LNGGFCFLKLFCYENAFSWTTLASVGAAIGQTELVMRTLDLRCHSKAFVCSSHNIDQGCQIFLDIINQNGEKYTKLPLNYRTVMRYVYLMVVQVYSKWS